MESHFGADSQPMKQQRSAGRWIWQLFEHATRRTDVPSLGNAPRLHAKIRERHAGDLHHDVDEGEEGLAVDRAGIGDGESHHLGLRCFLIPADRGPASTFCSGMIMTSTSVSMQSWRILPGLRARA